MYIGLRSGSLNNLHTEKPALLNKNAELLATPITNEKELTTIIYKVFFISDSSIFMLGLKMLISMRGISLVTSRHCAVLK